MEKFLNVKDDYVLKYAYYREPIAGTKYLDLNFDNLKVNEEVSFEIDSSNKYDDKAVKLYQNVFHLHVHIIPRKDGENQKLFSFEKKDFDLNEIWQKLKMQ